MAHPRTVDINNPNILLDIEIGSKIVCISYRLSTPSIKSSINEYAIKQRAALLFKMRYQKRIGQRLAIGRWTLCIWLNRPIARVVHSLLFRYSIVWLIDMPHAANHQSL